MASALKARGNELVGANAIIVGTARWEEAQPSLSSNAQLGMLCDYYRFTEAAYKNTYSKHGAPKLAATVAEKLTNAGLKPAFDTVSDYHHGTFVPMGLEAEIPIL